jgi:hypothetical protein
MTSENAPASAIATPSRMILSRSPGACPREDARKDGFRILRKNFAVRRYGIATSSLGVSPATLYRNIPAARTANTPGV